MNGDRKRPSVILTILVGLAFAASTLVGVTVVATIVLDATGSCVGDWCGLANRLTASLIGGVCGLVSGFGGGIWFSRRGR